MNKYVFSWALSKQQLDPPFCPFLCTLWHMFFTENENIIKTATLTLRMNILHDFSQTLF